MTSTAAAAVTLQQESRRQFHIIYVSVNAIQPGRRSRTREAIGAIRHVFLEADHDGRAVLAKIATRPDLPEPSYVLHSSPNRVHVFWRVAGFDVVFVEALQKQLARELGTDSAATAVTQTTRIPGFNNHKYTAAPAVTVDYHSADRLFSPTNFPATASVAPSTRLQSFPRSSTAFDPVENARRYLARVPPAVAGEHGDVRTFRVCCRLVRGFALDDEQALAVLWEWNNACRPPWRHAELLHKLYCARRYGREPIGALVEDHASMEDGA
jgi:hypothetical protein